MFYCQPKSRQKNREAAVRALISLTPAESKRLIAKGVAALPEVRRALEHGLVIIARGTTNAFVVEELTGNKIGDKSHYASGFIADGELCATPDNMLMNVVVLRRGKRVDTSPADALWEFGEGDVSIKGASAIDEEGNAAVLAAGADSGTIGGILPVILARGSHLIVPVGLEKLIPSVIQATQAAGVFHFKYSTGVPVAVVPMPNALVVTEVQAFEVLADVKVVPIAAGGIAGSEGTIVLSLEGTDSQIAEALSIVKSVKGEPPVGRPSGRANPPAITLDYDAMAQWQTLSDARRMKPGLIKPLPHQ
jgi:hypothetical protein